MRPLRAVHFHFDNKSNYWGDVAKKFQSHYKDNNALFADGRGSILGVMRKYDGEFWAESNLFAIEQAKRNGEKIIILSHSMGGAFAEGVQRKLESHGSKVDMQVALATYGANDFGETLNFGNTRTYQFNNGGDRLTNSDFKIEGKNVFKFINPGGGHMQWEFDWMYNYLPKSLDRQGYVSVGDGPLMPVQNGN